MTSRPPSAAGVADRRATIVRDLHAAGFLSVTGLADRLQVSPMTVRRDLRWLADAGELRIVHGGASVLHAAERGADFASRGRQHEPGKQRIARHAAALVPAHSTIAVDAGTTTYQLVRQLPVDFTGCLITHSVPVMQAALDLRCRVIGVGGELLGSSQAFMGPRAVEALRGLNADIAFMGAAGIRADGVLIASDLERGAKLAMMETAREVVLLVDHSKTTAVAPCTMAGLDRFHRIITDGALPTELERALASAGVQITVV